MVEKDTKAMRMDVKEKEKGYKERVSEKNGNTYKRKWEKVKKVRKGTEDTR